MLNHSTASELLALHTSIPTQMQDYQYRPQVQTPHGTYVEPLSPALSSLDFMHLPPHNAKDQQQEAERCLDGTSSTFIPDHSMFSEAAHDQHGLNSDGMQGEPFGMYEHGWNTELPSYIHDLLSGACKY